MEKTKKYTSSNATPHHQNPTEYSYWKHELEVQMQWLINELQNPKAPQQTHCTFVKHGPLQLWNCSGQNRVFFNVVTKILLLPTKFVVILPIKVLWHFHQINCITNTSGTVLLIFCDYMLCSNWKETEATKMTSMNINTILHIIPTFSNTANMLWPETDHNTRKSNCNK